MAFIGGKKSDSGPSGTAQTLNQPVTTKPHSSVVARDKGGPSVVGMDLTVNGNLTSNGEVHIEGEVQGDVRCASLIIGDNARVTGGVVAEDVVVRGNLMGTIRGMRVTLQSSSHVEGDIFHKSLAIEQGAFFEGKSRRAEDPTTVSVDSLASNKPSAPQSGAPATRIPKPGNSIN